MDRKSRLKENVVVSKINNYIDDLDDRLNETMSVAGFGFFVKMDDLFQILIKIKKELPSEINEAERILADKENIKAQANQAAQDIVDSAERRANSIIEAAEREAERLVSETYVMKKANEEANNVIMDAQSQAKSAISYANNYVSGAFDSILKGIEYLQSDTEKAKDQVINKLSAEEGRYSVAEDVRYSQSSLSSRDYEDDRRDDYKEDLGEYEDYDE